MPCNKRFVATCVMNCVFDMSNAINRSRFPRLFPMSCFFGFVHVLSGNSAEERTHNDEENLFAQNICTFVSVVHVLHCCPGRNVTKGMDSGNVQESAASESKDYCSKTGQPSSAVRFLEICPCLRVNTFQMRCMFVCMQSEAVNSHSSLFSRLLQSKVFGRTRFSTSNCIKSFLRLHTSLTNTRVIIKLHI